MNEWVDGLPQQHKVSWLNDKSLRRWHEPILPVERRRLRLLKWLSQRERWVCGWNSASLWSQLPLTIPAQSFLNQEVTDSHIQTSFWGASVVAQWLRILLRMQGTPVRALVREDPTCLRATKPVCHNYWACALEPVSHNYWSPRTTTPEARSPRARAPQQGKPPRWEARAPQQVAPTRRN